MNNNGPLGNKELYGYGIGNLGYGMILQAVTTYLVFFGTSILHLPGTLLGLVVSLSVVWDAVSDPIMGTLSDYTNLKRLGRRHLYIAIGTIGIAFFNVLLWNIRPEWSLGIKTVLVILCVFGLKTMATVFVTPYMALGGELTTDYHKRTTVQSVRTIAFVLGMGFTVVGGMLVFLRPTEAFPNGQMNGAGYRYLGVSTSGFMLLCGFITFVATYNLIPLLKSRIGSAFANKRSGSIMQGLKGDLNELYHNVNYRYVALAYLSANTATAIIGSIGLHVFTYTFRMSTTHIGIILGALFISNIVSQPFWIYYTKQHEKREAALLATRIGMIACLLFVLLVIFKDGVRMNPYLMMPFSLVGGFSVGGLLTLPLSMVGDTIDIEESHTGKRSEGLYYGGLTFSYKCSQAIAIFIIGILLDAIGFNSNNVTQSAFTELALGIILAAGCSLAFILTYASYKRYYLRHEDIELLQKTKN